MTWALLTGDHRNFTSMNDGTQQELNAAADLYRARNSLAAYSRLEDYAATLGYQLYHTK